MDFTDVFKLAYCQVWRSSLLKHSERTFDTELRTFNESKSNFLYDRCCLQEKLKHISNILDTLFSEMKFATRLIVWCKNCSSLELSIERSRRGLEYIMDVWEA